MDWFDPSKMYSRSTGSLGFSIAGNLGPIVSQQGTAWVIVQLHCWHCQSVTAEARNESSCSKLVN